MYFQICFFPHCSCVTAHVLAPPMCQASLPMLTLDLRQQIPCAYPILDPKIISKLIGGRGCPKNFTQLSKWAPIMAPFFTRHN